MYGCKYRQNKKRDITTEDKLIIENIIKNIATSFSREQSTRDWAKETIWFDAAPIALIGKDKVKNVFDEAVGKVVIPFDKKSFIRHY